MKIAVLSGKGGTGKTLVSVNLAYAIKDAAYVDCDVEEPNGDLYFKADYNESPVFVEIPEINHEKCTLCGMCTDFCKFNALAIIIDKIRVFSQLCHSCGGCKLVCPENAITEKSKSIGVIKESIFDGHKVLSGVMNIKEETGVKIIDQLIEKTNELTEDVVIDCPPGNGCSVMASIKNADYCVLVAEPTIFGLHNLKMVYELTKVFNKKTGIIINKYDGNKIINDFAEESGIDIIQEIPFDKRIAHLNSEGNILSQQDTYFKLFNNLYEKIRGEVK